jgi:hypothetical protein
MSGPTNQTVDRGAALHWYGRWLEAWNSHEPSRIRELITDDFRLITPTTVNSRQQLTTADQAEDYVAFVVRAYPDLIWTQAGPPAFADTAPIMTVPWHGTGTFSGVLDPPGVPGTGRPFAFDGVEVFEFRGDVASGVTAHYDLQGLMRQVLPHHGRPSEAGADSR